MAKGSRFFIFIIFLLGIFGLTSFAKAFSISPLRYLAAIEPGGSQFFTVTVKNEQPESRNYNLLVLGAKQDEEGHTLFGPNFSEAEDWITPEKDWVTVPALQARDFKFQIQVPQNAYPGAYALGLAVQERRIEPASSAGRQEAIGLQGRLLTLLSLQVAGEAKEVLVANKLEKKEYQNNQWHFALKLENAGNVDLPLQGEILIKGWRGEIKQSQPLYLGNNLLPSMSRNYQFNIAKGDDWLPGFYRVEAQINYGRLHQTIAKTALIIYFPWWFKAILFLIILIIVSAFIIARRKNSYVSGK